MKKLTGKEILNILAFSGMVITGSFIFLNLIMIVPLVLFLAAATLFFHGDSSELLIHLPAFIKVWFGCVIVFITSTLIVVINKFFKVGR